MSNQLNPSGNNNLDGGLEALVRTLRGLFFLLRVLIVVTFVGVLFSGAFYVKENEAVMLFRFGKLQQRVVDAAKGKTDVLTSGKWYWAWPAPIDEKKPIPAQTSITIRTAGHFWPKVNRNAAKLSQSAIKTTSLPPGEGGYLLTGDLNIFHMDWSVTYRVTDPKKYYLQFFDDPDLEAKDANDPIRPVNGRGVKELIRCLLENVALAETGTWRVEDTILGSRNDPSGHGEERITDRVQARLEKLVEDIDVGISIQQVTLLENQPPLATEDAFRQVFEAAQTRDRLVRDAEAYAAEAMQTANGEASRIVEEAKEYKTRVVEAVKAESKYFETVLKEYEANPDTMLMARYTDTLREVLANVETKYIVHASENGKQEIRLLLGPDPEKKKTAKPSGN